MEEEGIEARGIEASSRGGPSKGWVCPRCGYLLDGLAREGAATCPECGRITSEAEQREIERRRQMPRNLQRIAQFGFVFTLVMWGWSLVGLLVVLRDGRTKVPGTFSAFFISLLVCTVSVPLCWWVYAHLKKIHKRNEIWSWIAAHATWLCAIGALAILRLT